MSSDDGGARIISASKSDGDIVVGKKASKSTQEVESSRSWLHRDRTRNRSKDRNVNKTASASGSIGELNQSENNVTPPWKSKRRIRKLGTEVGEPAEKSHKFLKFIILLAIIVLSWTLWKNDELRENVKQFLSIDELKRLSMNQFQLYLHGRENYCDEVFEYQKISDSLRKRIVRQDDALDKIDSLLKQHDSFTAIALTGPQGVGKTLTLNLVQENFQWHLNTQQYIWSPNQPQRFKSLLNLIDGLTSCGQNAIFIDDIPLSSISIIDEFNKQLITHCTTHNMKLIVIYVFQSTHATQLHLDNVNLINFRQLNSDDVRQCISIESDRLNMRFTPDQIDDLLANIDVKRNGCKTVAAKVARIEIDDL